MQWKPRVLGGKHEASWSQGLSGRPQSLPTLACKPYQSLGHLHLALAHRGPSAPLCDLFYNSNRAEVWRMKNGVGRLDMKLLGTLHTRSPSPRSWIGSWHVEKTQDKRREKRWRQSKEAWVFSKEITKIIKDKNEVIIRKESLCIFWSPRQSAHAQIPLSMAALCRSGLSS